MLIVEYRFGFLNNILVSLILVKPVQVINVVLSSSFQLQQSRSRFFSSFQAVRGSIFLNQLRLLGKTSS